MKTSVLVNQSLIRTFLFPCARDNTPDQDLNPFIKLRICLFR